MKANSHQAIEMSETRLKRETGNWYENESERGTEGGGGEDKKHAYQKLSHKTGGYILKMQRPENVYF